MNSHEFLGAMAPCPAAAAAGLDRSAPLRSDKRQHNVEIDRHAFVWQDAVVAPPERVARDTRGERYKPDMSP
jgi:hypothetical protein